VHFPVAQLVLPENVPSVPDDKPTSDVIIVAAEVSVKELKAKLGVVLGTVPSLTL
jgi:hypothetical protein